MICCTVCSHLGDWRLKTGVRICWCLRTGPSATAYVVVSREKENVTSPLPLISLSLWLCSSVFVNILCISLVSRILFKKSDVLSMQFFDSQPPLKCQTEQNIYFIFYCPSCVNKFELYTNKYDILLREIFLIKTF